jgi:hypothetical protein
MSLNARVSDHVVRGEPAARGSDLGDEPHLAGLLAASEHVQCPVGELPTLIVEQMQHLAVNAGRRLLGLVPARHAAQAASAPAIASRLHSEPVVVLRAEIIEALRIHARRERADEAGIVEAQKRARRCLGHGLRTVTIPARAGHHCRSRLRRHALGRRNPAARRRRPRLGADNATARLDQAHVADARIVGLAHAAVKAEERGEAPATGEEVRDHRGRELQTHLQGA